MATLESRLGSLITAIGADIKSLTTSVASAFNLANATGTLDYARMAAGSTVTVLYNTGTSSYPTRPTSRTDLVVRWRGPSAPTIGGSYAVANVDEWVNTSL